MDIGLSSGFVSGATSAEERARRVEEKLTGILAAIRGDALGDHPVPGRGVPRAEPVSEGGIVPLPHGPYATAPEQLYAFPRSPGLEHRLGYGAGSLSSALRAARLGLNLVLSTIHSEATGPTLGHTQRALIDRYREEFARNHPDREPRVSVGRSILPIVTAEDEREFRGLKDFYDRLVTPDGRYTDAPDRPGQASPLYAGAPDEIVARLSEDPVLDVIDELVLTPLTELAVPQKNRVLTSVAEHVAPDLGWVARAEPTRTAQPATP